MGFRGPMTHRHFLLWKAWEAEEYNRPGRTDFYIMMLAAEVRRILNKHPEKIQPKDFLLRFGTGARKKQSLESAREASRAKWLGVVGGIKGVRVIEVDPETYNPYEEFDVTPYIVDESKK